MSTTVKIVADSISPKGKRLTTFQVRYWRGVHADLLTHRMLSRNSSSSRARPSKHFIDEMRYDTAMPYRIGRNQPGMQAREDLTGWRLWLAERLIRSMAWVNSFGVQGLMKLGVHKQVANRYAEPYTHINVVLTATEWGNFYNLRDHEDADPSLHHLASLMVDAQNASTPSLITYGGWHLPYVLDDERNCYNLESLLMMSTARCARVSFNLHDGTAPNPEKDFGTFGKLIDRAPVHASPLEHQATPLDNPDYACRNFRGWLQHRALVPGEYMPDYSKLR